MVRWPIEDMPPTFYFSNKKSPRGINPAVVLSALRVQNILRPRKIQAEVVLILKVGDLPFFFFFYVFAMII